MCVCARLYICIYICEIDRERVYVHARSHIHTCMCGRLRERNFVLYYHRRLLRSSLQRYFILLSPLMTSRYSVTSPHTHSHTHTTHTLTHSQMTSPAIQNDFSYYRRTLNRRRMVTTAMHPRSHDYHMTPRKRRVWWPRPLMGWSSLTTWQTGCLSSMPTPPPCCTRSVEPQRNYCRRWALIGVSTSGLNCVCCVC